MDELRGNASRTQTGGHWPEYNGPTLLDHSDENRHIPILRLLCIEQRVRSDFRVEELLMPIVRANGELLQHDGLVPFDRFTKAHGGRAARRQRPRVPFRITAGDQHGHLTGKRTKQNNNKKYRRKKGEPQACAKPDG